jgi:hypothetical protein
VDEDLDVPSMIHQEGWTVWIGGTKLTTDHSEAVRVTVSSEVIKKWLQEKEILPQATFDRVDWETIGKAMKTFPPPVPAMGDETRQRTLWSRPTYETTWGMGD